MKKKNLIFGLALCLLAIKSHSQFVTGNSMFVNIGTVFTVDSLVLIPAEGLNLGGDYSLNVDHTAVPGSPKSSIMKTYIFNTPVNFSGSVGVIYRPDELNGNTESLLEVANSLSDESAFVTFTGSSRDLGKHYIFKDVADLDIRMLTLVDGQSALPVTLTSFEAAREESGVRLNWNTSWETNSDFFEIQYSRNGKEWRPVGRVASVGESKLQNGYTFLHDSPVAGDNLYRLKMVDRDQTFAYSQIRSIAWDGENALTIFPNPAADQLEIRGKGKVLVEKVKITNAEGVIVKEIASPDKPVNLQGIGAGHYILNVMYRDGSSESRHFIKN